MVRFIKEHLEDNLKTLVKVDKPTDVAQLQTEQVIVCSTPYLEEL
jgi:hypothetical protein